MNALLCFVVLTSNILGSFNDPFEFDGDYGEESNPAREYVFEQVVSKEALAVNLSDSQVIEQMPNKNPTKDEIQKYREQLVEKAIQIDGQHGPTLKQLVSSDLIQQLSQKQQELEEEGFSKNDLANILDFLDRYQEKKIFSFFRNAPSDLLSLDKILRDKAARDGRNFDLPILSSTELLRGESTQELKLHLLDSVFTKETLSLVKSEQKLKEAIEKLDPCFLEKYLGEGAVNTDLVTFTSSGGQVFFYWLYQALNLHLISQNKAMIDQINKVKQVFAETLGNPNERARLFKDKLIAADVSVIFTQESDAVVPSLLTKDELFHPVDVQNPGDGTLVFLRGTNWEKTYTIIPIEGYEGYEKGRLNVILATKKDTGEKFLLASCHGNSTRAEDGRLQIAKIVEKFHELRQQAENNNLQLIIGIDANTKTEEDVRLLRDQLEALGLIATDVGPTTVKKRMVTVQHSKAGRFAVDEEDYVILLKPESGGLYRLATTSVGFKEEKPDPSITLPNINNPSDHYPVGAALDRIYP